MAPGARAVIDTLRLTAEDAAGLLERREVSTAELRGAYLAAIDERNAELNAYLHVHRNGDDVGQGVPIALKDCITTDGVPTTAGSRILEGYVPVFDSTVAARCKAAGLPLLGKTNMDEFAMGSSTENSAYGPTRNPWDPRAFPAARRAVPRRPSQQAWRRGRWDRTPAAPSSSRPRSAASSACAPRTARCRATASSRSRRASTRSVR